MYLTRIWAGLLALTLMTNCGGDKTSTTTTATDDASVPMSGSVNKLEQMAEQIAEDSKKEPVETVDFRSLKELLPADAHGLARREATGEKNGAMGFSVSTAEGRYANDDNSQRIRLAIMDTGGSGALMGLAAWSMIEVDRETEQGYEKTTTVNGYKAFEKFNNTDQDGELAVMVDRRFVVTAKGRGVSMETLREVVGEVDLKKLSGLK